MTNKSLLAFDKIAQLAKTDVAYATGDPLLRPFYAYAPALSSFPDILAKRKSFETPRTALVEVLKEQYRELPAQALVSSNIHALSDADTFSVTTAHQPSLLLGPLYFLYKAVTTINLAEAVSKQSGNKIVPVFVLGSEDHDLEELNHISLFNKRLEWLPNETGAVGSMRNESLAPLLETLDGLLGNSENARFIFERIQKAYTGRADFAAATQALLHDLFGRFGLLVLNMNHPTLKRFFIPIMRRELLEQTSFEVVNKTISELNAKGFKTQANPREINLFYMLPGLRERIVLENGVYKVLNTERTFTQTEILAELEQHPERFSPNVVLRPVYQELILPNLAYVGGGGELAYWLERKTQFETFGVPYPALIRRNSVLWLDRDAQKRLQKFGFSAQAFFEDTESLVRAYISAHTEHEVDLAPEIKALQALYQQLASKAAAVDPTLEKAVRAEEVKSIAGLEQWQGRLVRAEKQKHEVVLNQLRALKEKLFPGNGLQERSDNFLSYYLKYGPAFINALKEHLGPFDAGFVILEEE